MKNLERLIGTLLSLTIFLDTSRRFYFDPPFRKDTRTFTMDHFFLMTDHILDVPYS